MAEISKPDEIALNRYQIIAPIIAAEEEKADEARLALLKNEACALGGISMRTVRRWLAGYSQDGFEGLKPRGRCGSKLGGIPEEIIEEAILLRREVPSRSIPQIIEILEMEGKAPAGLLRRTTLQDKLQQRGYSSRQMKLYQQGGMAARRYQRKERGDMWHADIKYGPYLTIDGKKKQIYLVSFLDDATRYVVHGEFYDNQNQLIVEDCLRKAILKEGLPKRVYFDNGPQFKRYREFRKDNEVYMRKIYKAGDQVHVDWAKCKELHFAQYVKQNKCKADGERWQYAGEIPPSNFSFYYSAAVVFQKISQILCIQGIGKSRRCFEGRAFNGLLQKFGICGSVNLSCGNR